MTLRSIIAWLAAAGLWLGIVTWRESAAAEQAREALGQAAALAENGAPGAGHDETLARLLAESLGFQRLSFLNPRGQIYAEAVLPRDPNILLRVLGAMGLAPDIVLEAPLSGSRLGRMRAWRQRRSATGDATWLGLLALAAGAVAAVWLVGERGEGRTLRSAPTL